MDYKISVKEFCKAVNREEIDSQDFLEALHKELKGLDKKFSFFQHLAKPSKLGLPLSVKDCICVEGMPSCAGSRILDGYRPPFSASVVEKGEKFGMAVVGKTNQDEFGFGTFSTNSGFGVPKNPMDPSRTCGGSSGGAAGLTAALEFPHIALAESTGGSISCPAAFCGVVGLTPTYGLVSRYGLIDYANSLDKIGAMGKGVEDVALLLSVIGGHDQRDSTSLNQDPKEYTKNLDKSIKGLKIGLPKEYFGEGVNQKVGKKVRTGIKRLEDLGAECQEISLPLTRYALPAYYIIALSEASTNLAKFCGLRYGKEEKIEGNFNQYFSKVRTRWFTKEAKRRILVGSFVRMAGYRDQYYLKAMKLRTLIINEFKQAFKRFDVLAAPTMPVIAPKFSQINKMGPLENYMMDILTVGPNLAGIPHISIPCGLVSGMPVGLHILGGHLQEGKVLQFARAFEKS